MAKLIEKRVEKLEEEVQIKKSCGPAVVMLAGDDRYLHNGDHYHTRAELDEIEKRTGHKFLIFDLLLPDIE